MLSFKFVNHEDDIRRVRFESFPTFVALQHFAAQLYGYQDVTLKYTDDENDLVTIKSDADLAQAFAIKRSMNNGGVFRLNVSTVSTANTVQARDATQRRSARIDPTTRMTGLGGYVPVHLQQRRNIRAPPVAAAAAVAVAPPPTVTPEQRHNGVCCDGCGVWPLRGTRYKCTECPDFDLCGSCRRNVHHPAHAFWKLNKPPKSSTASPAPASPSASPSASSPAATAATRASPPSRYNGLEPVLNDLLAAFGVDTDIVGMAISDAADPSVASSRTRIPRCGRRQRWQEQAAGQRPTSSRPWCRPPPAGAVKKEDGHKTGDAPSAPAAAPTGGQKQQTRTYPLKPKPGFQKRGRCGRGGVWRRDGGSSRGGEYPFWRDILAAVEAAAAAAAAERTTAQDEEEGEKKNQGDDSGTTAQRGEATERAEASVQTKSPQEEEQDNKADTSQDAPQDGLPKTSGRCVDIGSAFREVMGALATGGTDAAVRTAMGCVAAAVTEAGNQGSQQREEGEEKEEEEHTTSMGEAADDGGPWVCGSCTFLNISHRIVCEACGEVVSSPAASILPSSEEENADEEEDAGEGEDVWGVQLQQLARMGFEDSQTNRERLEISGGNVGEVVNWLLQQH